MIKNNVKSYIRLVAFVAGFLGVLAFFEAGYSMPVGQAQTAQKSSEKHNKGHIKVELRKGMVIKLTKPASSVLVANTDIADVEARSPKQIFVYGKALGETSIYAYDENENEVLSATIKVTHNISSLERTVRESIPEGNATFRSTDRGLVIEGSVPSPEASDKVSRIASTYLTAEEPVINLLNVQGSDQVTLKVRIAEVSKTNLKTLGINLGNLAVGKGSFAFGLITGRTFIDPGDLLVSGDESLIRLPDQNNARIIGNRGSFGVDALIDALHRDGYAKVLAEPNLTAISGRAASFLAGGEIPIPVPGDDGTVTIEYRPFGVSLNFVPTVLSKDRISLSVAPEVSSLSQVGALSFSGFSVPAFSVRRANTTVELGSGQSLAIAGLLQNDITNDIDKFPWLGDVPILGSLFSSSRFQKDETELVIIVTPYIVSPVNEKDLAIPGENHIQPSDFERIFLGKLFSHKKPSTSSYSSDPIAAVGNMKKTGKIGYILE